MQSKINHYDRSQTESYISHQLKNAGCDRKIFTDATIDEIYRFASGTTGLIDKVCTGALLYGSQSKKRIIDDHAIKLIIECEFS